MTLKNLGMVSFMFLSVTRAAEVGKMLADMDSLVAAAELGIAKH